jgi:copper chaperone CopZ
MDMHRKTATFPVDGGDGAGLATTPLAAAPASGGPSEIEFAVSGMTCGSCAARIQKVLGRQSGVVGANVNFATQKATLAVDPALVRVDDLHGAVAKIGYRLS